MYFVHMKGYAYMWQKSLFYFDFFFIFSVSSFLFLFFYVSNFCKTFLQRFAFDFYPHSFFCSFCSLSGIQFSVVASHSTNFHHHIAVIAASLSLSSDIQWHGSRVCWLDPTFTIRVAIYIYFCCCLPHLFGTRKFWVAVLVVRHFV